MKIHSRPRGTIQAEDSKKSSRKSIVWVLDSIRWFVDGCQKKGSLKTTVTYGGIHCPFVCTLPGTGTLAHPQYAVPEIE